MENKINIAELLKDCPKGMELDCALYDNVFFDGIDTNDDNFPISLYYKHNNIKNGFSVTKYGTYYNHQNSKCIIFPKGKTTWEGFQRPFKDGDILYAVDEGKEFIFILKHIFENGRVYCYLNLKGDDLRIQNVWLTDYNPTHRLATEEEKQKLFDAIKDNGYKWNAETKTLEMEEKTNKFDITTLKPFSRVLVRIADSYQWHATWFSHIDERQEFFWPYVTVSGKAYAQIIPFEDNEHLLGTINDCDEYYKTWKDETDE